MLPYLTRQAPWFAFLVHPRNNADLLNSGLGRFLRCFEDDDTVVRRRMSRMPALVAGTVSIAGSALWGEIIVVTALPENMMGRCARERVISAAHLALRRGARIIGLGALTSPATLGGRLVANRVGKAAVVTNGNALTAAVIHDQVVRILRDKGLVGAATVAVVGCTGSVGVATCRLLAASGIGVNLVGRSAKSVARRFRTIPKRSAITDLEAGLRYADVVVTLTHDSRARVMPIMLKPGCVVLDCSQPRNTAKEDLPAFQKLGIDVVEGATVTIPGFDCTYDFGLVKEGSVFACLAETYLFSRLGIRKHSIGHPTVDLARHLFALGQSVGLTVDSGQSFHIDHVAG